MDYCGGAVDRSSHTPVVERGNFAYRISVLKLFCYNCELIIPLFFSGTRKRKKWRLTNTNLVYWIP